MRYQYFLFFIPNQASFFAAFFATFSMQALTPLECAQHATRALTHVFDHLHMGSIKAEGPLNIFLHKTYGNLSELFRATYINLGKHTFSSPSTEYFFTKTNILSVEFWVVTLSCIYVTQKLVRFCYHSIRRKKSPATSFNIVSHEGVKIGEVAISLPLLDK